MGVSQRVLAGGGGGGGGKTGGVSGGDVGPAGSRSSTIPVQGRCGRAGSSSPRRRPIFFLNQRYVLGVGVVARVATQTGEEKGAYQGRQNTGSASMKRSGGLKEEKENLARSGQALFLEGKF